ncbi:MAG: hypothetical protein LC778_10260 [Acidobacteria bacterium]|nr:hypothetical protein [Acidobacteriota bacterium]
MTNPVYATPAELTSYTDETDENLLMRASAVIDNLLVGAVYKVDSNGIAIDAEQRQAIKNAVLAQASFWKAGYGSEHGSSAYGTVSIGSVTLGEKSGGNNSKKELIAPQVLAELRRARLLPIRARVV